MITENRKILFIDDSLSMHSLIRTYLEKSGYCCICASNGYEGLKLVLEEKPDLILLDYLMPGLDGGQVYAELTQNPTYHDYKNIPVIILTAKEFDPESKAKFIEGGVNAYLHKPFGMRELLNVIENVFILNDIKSKNIQLQREIKCTKEYLELLLDTIPMGILSCDQDGIIKKMNSYFDHLLEFEQPDEILSKKFNEIDLLQDDILQHHFTESLRQGTPLTIDRLDCITARQKQIALKIKTIPLYTADQISGVLLIAQDITDAERKQHELAMLSQISQFMNRTIQLDQLLHLILTALTAGCAFGFSRAMILLINRETGILEGKMGVGPASQEDAHRIWQELSKEKISLPNFLEKYGSKLSKDDMYFNNLVQSIRIPANHPDCVFTNIITDKTPLMVKAESPEMENCSEIFQNLSMENFLAVPLMAQDNVIGVIVADNFFSQHPIDSNMLDLLALFATQAGLALERAEAYFDLEQKKNRLEKAYRELKQTQERLIHSERLATVGRMAAQVAHEVRNPLVAIGGFARNILKLTENKNQDEKLSTYAKIIADEVSRLETILSEVLTFSKLSSPELSRQNINDLIHDIIVILNIRTEIAEQKIMLEKDLSGDLPPIMVDPQQIKQVLLNLCENALYSMQHGGTLSISSRLVQKQKIQIKIQDTGEGIPPHVLEEMFDPFFTTKKNGIGLGLPISLQIIRSHGGDIHVESKVGFGTTFTVTLNITNNS